MRIGIDGRLLTGKLTGIGRYTYEICKELDRALPEALFFIYSQNKIGFNPISYRWEHREENTSVGKMLKSVVWQKLLAGKLIKKDKLNFYWASASFLPSLEDDCKSLLTAYDLNYKLYPKTMPLFPFMSYKLFFEKDILSADFIASISIGTAEKVQQYFSRKSDLIIKPAVSSLFVKPNETQVEQTLEYYGIDFPYILALGTLEPRKNISKLIEAFIDLKSDGFLCGYRLIIVGGTGWKNAKLKKDIENLDSILSLGFVADEHLPSLYRGSKLFIFPSVYEGFGMPVLEARACGACVLTSDIVELREAGGRNSIYIQPTRQGIYEGILRGISDRDPKNSFDDSINTWEDAAGVLATFFKSNLGQGSFN